MLKKVGFKYLQQVDPFDGGPHLWCNVDDLVPVGKMAKVDYSCVSTGAGEFALLCRENQAPGEFRAMCLPVLQDGASVTVGITEPEAKTIEAALGLRPGERVAVMPFY